jgi:transposase
VNIRYRVELSEEVRAQLTALLSGGKHAARKLRRAQILLAADAGVSDDVIANSVSVGGSTVYRTKRRFVEGNLELALSEEARPRAPRKLSGKERRCWWRRPARDRLRAESVGPWTCWLARWSG